MPNPVDSREPASAPADRFEQRRALRLHVGLLAGITAVGAALRMWGIRWGAPERIDLHPDEFDYVLTHALAMAGRIQGVLADFGSFDNATLDPVFLNYPGFLKYLVAFGTVVIGGVDLDQKWHSFVLGRTIVAVFGAATVPAVYGLARELGARGSGALIAALWMALLPLHVWESHVAVTDVPMTFWIVVTLWAAVRLLRVGGWGAYALAGAALGFSVGSKYTAAIFTVAIVLAALIARRPLRESVKRLALCAAVSLACCFVVTPYSFLRFDALLDAMAFEHAHVTTGHPGFSAVGDGPQYRRGLYQLLAGWPFSLGFALYASCAAGAVWAVRHLDRRALIVLGSTALFFAVTARWVFVPLRYSLPLLVVAVTFTGLWQGAWLASAERWKRGAAWAVVLVTAAYTGLFTVQTTARYANETRLVAARWIERTSAPGTSLLLCGSKPHMAIPRDRTRFQIQFSTDQAIANLPADAPYDLIEISSQLYNRYYRSGNQELVVAYDRLRDPQGPFERVARFESRFVHKDWYVKLDPMFEGYFLSPTIELYRAKNRAAPAP
jgi:hypothetical protein